MIHLALLQTLVWGGENSFIHLFVHAQFSPSNFGNMDTVSLYHDHNWGKPEVP